VARYLSSLLFIILPATAAAVASNPNEDDSWLYQYKFHNDEIQQKRNESFVVAQKIHRHGQ
jgi:hypothetical protein